MRFLWLFPLSRATQCCKHTVLHFGSRLAREGNRNYLLGLGDNREQSQVALNQQLRFAGSGRCLNNERAGYIKRTLARVDVIVEKLRFTRHCAAPCSESAGLAIGRLQLTEGG